ncbi:MAG: hypothetical protein U9N35_02135 [Euryarchaeota archaeon]|nr:hypothetical protein [Euryarchaeota archaeon]
MKEILSYYGVKMDLKGYRTVSIEGTQCLIKKEMTPLVNEKTKAAGTKIRNSEISLEFAFKIAKNATRNTMIINKKAETLFLYGRDVFKKNIVKGDLKKGKKLVLNRKRECLGIGYWNGDMIRNIKDRGMFLRSMD